MALKKLAVTFGEEGKIGFCLALATSRKGEAQTEKLLLWGWCGVTFMSNSELWIHLLWAFVAS